MKKLLIILIALTAFISCKSEPQKEQVKKGEIAALKPISDEVLESAVIYEANIRQYSPEGTFNKFTEDIPVLKELGVKIIWLMPINPISEIKRKATGDLFTSEIEDVELRKKYLGSYYSVSDYKAINPEFGTKEDFDNLVKEAHKNGIYVIVDWVPNHTGWDHPWITAHPDFYTQNEKGEIIDPINPDTGESWGWTDTADLNYDNKEMRKEMISDLKYWVENYNIDGYRMDVAHKVPVDFFETAVDELKKIKPIFMLAEAEQPDLLHKAFDMHYGWEAHHIFNEIANGKKDVSAFDEYVTRNDSILEKDDINMNFITNHDENSWNGTLLERMPNKKEVFTALIYLMKGMPLIYSGQEYDLSHRLKFFEKDEIPKEKGAYFDLLKKLGALKNNNTALNGGKNAASYIRIQTSDDKSILAFSREKNGQKVTFIANLSNKNLEFTLDKIGESVEFFTNEKVNFSKEKMNTLKAWDYKIYIY
ncbi:glycosidase [Lutibacter oceani]|uniref:Glycosidase n=1 Tax=Lutibacter oceani TaxID=1853311 RepID=A0A3D9RQP7_9FLAO|nr:alpha-amylase family glycosyl hydrolase [Lutibacter oceani]REE80021.1 glycosidase [Lutibacter oceani]